MFDPNKINDIVSKITASLPPGVKQVPQDIEQNIRCILQAGFEKMDLVTREEFDAQMKVLARTREKLETLEKQLVKLQDKHKSDNG